MNPLRISINANKIESAYGGGNQAANTIEDYLTKKGHNVYRNLKKNLDVILVFSSRYNAQTTSYGFDDISDYIVANPNTIVIQRVNSCDEQRGSDLGINSSMLKYNKLADYTIFISQFIKKLFETKGLIPQNSSQVILNGADNQIFYPLKHKILNKHDKLKIVTHHWSSNFMKGFDIYERLDQLLDIQSFKNSFEFTYIGNVPVGVNFMNTTVIKPLSKNLLAEELRQHHIYLTAARNEAAGMHHIEGMMCGLPVLFLNSGALPEYCRPYGIEFSLINFEDKLMEIKEQYHDLHEKILTCPYSSELMASQYEKKIVELVNIKKSKPKTNRRTSKILMNKIKKPFRKLHMIHKKVSRYYKKHRDINE